MPDSLSKVDGMAVGLQTANNIIALRATDGRRTPIGTTSPLPAVPAQPGLWRLTPPTFSAPQTPWLGDERPFILQSADQVLPAPPPSLSSDKWAKDYEQVRSLGSATSTTRTAAQTAFARFWLANVILQYNMAARDLATAHGLGVVDTARLVAMVNLVGADAGVSVMHAKYEYRFWRPSTAIDPAAVTADGYGPTPGFDDGNPATVEEPGWKPLLTTPNHPEYPSAHATVTSAMAEVFTEFFDTSRINLDIHGFDPAGPVGNLDAVVHFDTARELRTGIVNARIWAGLHYKFSNVAGVRMGRQLAEYDLDHAFQRAADDDDDG